MHNFATPCQTRAWLTPFKEILQKLANQKYITRLRPIISNKKKPQNPTILKLLSFLPLTLRFVTLFETMLDLRVLLIIPHSVIQRKQSLTVNSQTLNEILNI